MNNDENNELEKTQVIEISDEDVTIQPTKEVDSVENDEISSIADMNNFENETLNEENADDDSLSSLPEIGDLENENVPVSDMNNIESEPAPAAPEETLEETVMVAEETPAVTEEATAESNPTVPQETVVEKSIPTQNNDFVEKERKIWPIIVILVIVVLGGLFAYYYFVLTKPINVINRLVNDTYSNVKKLANNNSSDKDKIDINSLIFDSNFSVSSDSKEYADYSGLNAKVYYALDLKDNKSKTDLTLSIKDQKLTDIAMSTIGNRTYYDFKDAFPKVVYMETEGEESLDISSFIDQKELNEKTSDYLYLFELVKNTILKNISEEKLSKKMLIKDIDGKKVPVVEVTYKIDYKEYKKLHTAVLNAIIDDSRALTILSSDYEKPEDVKEELISERDELSELDFGSDIDVIIDIDAFTNKLVSLEIKDSSSKIVMRNSSTDMNINITDSHVGSDENFESIDITIDKKEKKVFADVKIQSDEETIRVALTLKANELTNTLLDVNASIILYDEADINKEALTVAGSFKLELNKMITTIDIANAVNINDLSQSEMMKLSKAMESFTESLGTISGAVEIN